MAFRHEKVCSLLQNLSASFISREFIGKPGILISVTKIEISKDFKKSTVFVSIFPEEKEKEILKSLKRRLSDLRDYVKSNAKMKFLPFFEIKTDQGEKRRQKIEELLKK
ncbi:ribosome-binding factor A [Patescibacteria group bacterium]|nr:ribosome-binding factor A [Patescibacteria group bacterium]